MKFEFFAGVGAGVTIFLLLKVLKGPNDACPKNSDYQFFKKTAYQNPHLKMDFSDFQKMPNSDLQKVGLSSITPIAHIAIQQTIMQAFTFYKAIKM